MGVRKRIRIRAVLIILGIAIGHLLLCKAIIAFVLSDPFQNSVTGSAPGMGTLILVNATRILYFPVVTLSLYSRKLFPGDLIYIPIFANSLLWGIGVYLVFVLCRFISRGHKPAPRK